MSKELVNLYGKDVVDTLQRCSNKKQIDEEISQLVKGIGKTRHAGSVTHPGWLYQGYALPEQHVSHRTGTVARLNVLKNQITNIKDKTFIDIGCANGAISIGLVLLGAKFVTAIDYDPTVIKIAKLIATKYNVIDRINFVNSTIEDYEFPKADVVIWFSQWMWIVKLKGMEFARNLLYKTVFDSAANEMYFESSADDGRAAIKGYVQKDIEDELVNCTPYRNIDDLGPCDNWPPDHNKRRHLFKCHKQKFNWKTSRSIVIRTDRQVIRKIYKNDHLWAKNWELKFYKLLEKYPYFPTVISYGDNFIDMEWVGNEPVHVAKDINDLIKIGNILDKHNIIHRDINPKNLRVKDGKLFLFDFEWAVMRGNLHPYDTDRGNLLGRGYYSTENFDNMDAIQKIIKDVSEQNIKREQ